MSCTDCNQNIPSPIKSIIPTPKCRDCQEYPPCEQVNNASCLFYNGPALDCLGIVSGMSFIQVLSQLELSCSNSSEAPSGTCKVKVSEEDCCDYLENKFLSTTLTISKTNVEDCEKITINEKPRTYTLANGYVNNWIGDVLGGNGYPGIPLKYNITNNDVRLFGSIIKSGGAINNEKVTTIATIAPTYDKVLTTTASAGGSLRTIFIVIGGTTSSLGLQPGEIRVSSYTPSTGTIAPNNNNLHICFDGIIYDKSV